MIKITTFGQRVKDAWKRIYKLEETTIQTKIDTKRRRNN